MRCRPCLLVDIINPSSIPILIYEVTPEGQPNGYRMASIEQPEKNQETGEDFEGISYTTQSRPG